MLLNDSREEYTATQTKKGWPNKAGLPTAGAASLRPVPHAFLAVATLVAVTLVSALVTVPVNAQICLCSSTEPFGSCNSGFFGYATEGELPGSATVAPDPNEADPGSPDPAPRFLYIADLFSGRSFRYPVGEQGGNLTLDDPEEFFSPGGTRSTSGLTFNPNTASLYWAITDVRLDAQLNIIEVPLLVKTGVDLATLRSPAENLIAMQSAVEIDLFALASELGLPRVGEVGDLVIHEVDNEFWAVDITNNVYFAFGFDGQPVEQGGEIKHFRNQRSNDGEPAFGAFFTYALMDGISCFDVAVGSLVEGEVSVVERVFAESGTMNGVEYTYGDPVGLSYNIRDTLDVEDDFGFGIGQITGIAHWTDACGAGQNVEVLMDIGESLEDARIRIASTDPATFADVGVASVSCSSTKNDVVLNWRQYSDLSGLTITRMDLATGQAFQVLPRDGEDGRLSAGIHEFNDTRVPDGVYEYRFAVTSSSGVSLADRVCLTSVGRGSVLDSVDYLDNAQGDANPFGITYVGQVGEVLVDRLVVADSASGFGHTFTTGGVSGTMEYTGSFPGPYYDNFNFEGGSHVGVAWSEANQELTWLTNLNGQNLIRAVQLVIENGQIVGVTPDTRVFEDASRIQAPLNMIATPALGDLDFDPFGDQFWSVDRITGDSFSFTRDGALTGTSFLSQIPNPFDDGSGIGVSRGGISVADATSTILELDWIGGATDATEQTRVLYGRSQAAGSERITLPGSETFRFDLRPSTGARNFAGLTSVRIENSMFSYVVALDMSRIYKVQISTGISGNEFRRGDANSDGNLNVSDAVFMLLHQFAGSKTPVCLDSADVNDDETLAIDDPVHLFLHLFGPGAPPAPPFEICGFDFEPGLTCDEASCVEPTE